MKNFIIKTPYNIKTLQPIAEVKNEFGVTENFYFIDSNSIKKIREFYGYQFTKLYTERYLKSETITKIEADHIDNINHAINRDTIAIIDKPFRLAKFIQKDNWQKLNTSTVRKILLS